MRVAAVIQARMNSERFPGKVLEKIMGYPMIWHIVERVKRSITVDQIIVATTDKKSDEPLVWECQKMGISVIKGYEEDVLGRYYMASQIVKADKICRVTADNPLIEPVFIDMAVARMCYSDEDYIAIDGAPIGTGIEVFKKELLKFCTQNASQDYQREHVTPFIRENSDIFRVSSITAPSDLFFPDLRLTVDTVEDMKLIKKIYHKLYRSDAIVNLKSTINLLLEEPEWCRLNSHIQQRSII